MMKSVLNEVNRAVIAAQVSQVSTEGSKFTKTIKHAFCSSYLKHVGAIKRLKQDEWNSRVPMYHY